MATSTVRVEVEAVPGKTVDSDSLGILLWLLSELRYAKTTADVALAAGCAHQDLLDLLAEGEDCTESSI